jgi:hypothetical protein
MNENFDAIFLSVPQGWRQNYQTCMLKHVETHSHLLRETVEIR